MSARLRELSDEVRELEDRLRGGGGSDKVARQHKQGKLTARERIERLFDAGTRFLEIGLLVAYDEYDGQAPAAGVVTASGDSGTRQTGHFDPTKRRASWAMLASGAVGYST